MTALDQPAQGADHFGDLRRVGSHTWPELLDQFLPTAARMLLKKVQNFRDARDRLTGINRPRVDIRGECDAALDAEQVQAHVMEGWAKG